MPRKPIKTSAYVERIASLEREVAEGARCMNQLLNAIGKAHGERAMARAEVKRLKNELAARPEPLPTDYQTV